MRRSTYSLRVLRRGGRIAGLVLAAALAGNPAAPARAQDAGKSLSDEIAALARSGSYAEALPLAEKNVSQARAAHGEMSLPYAEAVGWQAYLLLVLSRIAEAEPLFKRSLEIYESLRPPGHLDIATAVNNLGFLYQITDRLAEAEVSYKRALEIREKALAADDPLVAESLNNLAQVYKHQGRTLESVPLLQRSLAIRRKRLSPTDPLMAQSMTNLGAAFERLGKFADAEPYFRKALEIRRASQAPDHPEVAGAMNKLAQNLSSQGRLEEADRLFAEAFDARSKTLPADHLDVADMLHDRAQNLNAMKRYAEAEQLLARALAIRRRLLPPNHPSIAHTLADLASVVLSEGRADEALGHIRSGVAILLARGKLDALGKQRFQEFVKIAWRAGERQKAPGGATRALLDEALISGQRATATPTSAAVSQMAARFAAGDERLNRLIRRRDDIEAEQAALERDLSGLLALPAGKRRVAVETVRARLSDVARRLAEADRELEKQFPRYFALINPEPLPVARIQELLRPDEVLVNFMSTFDEVYVWTVSKDGAQWKLLDIAPQKLADDVSRLRAMLDLGALSAAGAAPELFDLGLAHELYAALFGPVEAAITGRSHLIVVANGPLTSLPVQLLVKSRPAIARPSLAELEAYRGADWIVRHHAVSVLPSVTSLSAIREVAGKPKAASPLIGFANPVLGGRRVASVDDAVRGLKTHAGPEKASAAPKAPFGKYSAFWRGPAADLDALRSGLQELPETETELKSVARNLSTSDDALLLGEAATEKAVKHARLAQYGIVYFATHGLVAGEVQGLGEPALVFSLPRTPTEEDDGLLTASEVTQLDLDADWVVLSACNTAAGDAPGAEALSGLARAFFYAGARAILVSHWRVGSEAAAALATTTFDVLRRQPEIGRAEAVRRAMVALLDDRQDVWNAYPAFWAPFSVVGEGAR